MTIAIIVLVVVVALIIAAVAIYNNLVQLRNRVDNAWSQIDVQLQRRLDLIPNLVETVKGYAAHESATLQAVTDARAAAASAATPDAKIAANRTLVERLTNLMATAEAYPDLKASQNFAQLQCELAETEDKISYMRQSYNDTVMKYNTAIQTFPSMLVAGPLGFAEVNSFDAHTGAENAPAVGF